MFNRSLFISFLVLFFSTASAGVAQVNSFILSADRVSSEYTATYLGNGNIGVSSSQLGTMPTHSYMAWIYEHYPGDVARIASLPAWDAVNFYNGSSWLNETEATGGSITNYRQTLDMYDGVLKTSYVWNEAGNPANIATTLFVSRSNPNLAAMEFTVAVRKSGPVRVLFPIVQWSEPNRMDLARIADIKVKMIHGLPDVWYPGHMKIEKSMEHGAEGGAVESVVAKPDGNSVRVAIAENISWYPHFIKAKITADTTEVGPSITVGFTAKAGTIYRFYRYAGLFSSRETKDPLLAARRTASNAALSGFPTILKSSQAAWHKLWRTNIIVKGDARLQKVIHSSMFYLLSSARAGSDFGIPPMGLSSDGYYGHIFWDSDTWMFPPLLLTHPDIAKSMVMFRYKALHAAEANARLNGYQGAMYPWESDENGNEACPKFAYQNALYENHVTGDVAFAQWQYYLATENKSWLERYGYPVIKETADFWTSRVKYNAENKTYNIDHVVSVDEGLIGVNNDAYTNLVARRNLEIATRAAKILGQRPNPMWNRVANGLYIPYDSTRHCYLTYQNAPPQSLGAVVPLLYYPLELKVPNEVKKNDLVNAFQFMKKNGTGVMMGITLYQIVAAEIQNRNLFEDFYKMSYEPYIRGSFNVFAETPENMSTNFLTGTGGFLQQVLFGYTGLRITSRGLVKEYEPMLPSGVKSLEITNLHFRGKRYDVTVEHGITRLIRK